MKRRINSDEICRYLESRPQKPTLRELAKIFGYRDFHSLRRLFTRVPCLSFEKTKISGNKLKYICSHSTEKHLVKRFKKSLGHTRGGLGAPFVQDSQFRTDILPHLEQSTYFSDELILEVHGVQWQSPPDRPVCFLDIHHHETYPWVYCDLTINIDSGVVRAWISPNEQFPKYGLSAERYIDLVRFRDQKLQGILGYDLGFALQPIMFDLHQDDVRFEWRGAWQGEHIVAGVMSEYQMTLQEYGVVREDHPTTPSRRRIRRREIRYKTQKTVANLADPIKSVLSLPVDPVRAIGDLTSVKEHIVAESRYLREAVNHTVPVLINKVNRIDEVLDNHVDGLRTVMLRESEEIKQTVDTLGHDVQISFSDVGTSIVAAISGMNSNLGGKLDTLNYQANETNQLITDLIQEVMTWNSLAREQRLEILEELRSQGKSWRKIADSLNVSNHQKLQQLWKRHKDTLDNHVDSRRTVAREEFVEENSYVDNLDNGVDTLGTIEPDEFLLQKIITTLRQVGGLNSRKLREKMRVNNQKLQDHLAILEYLNVIQKTGSKGRRGYTWEVIQ